MTDCYYCNNKITDIPYRCKYCGMIFCNKHRLPENHVCAFDLRKKEKFMNSQYEKQLLYQDALEYVRKELTVAKIYDYVSSKSMTKSEAIELLNYILENSDDIEVRKISLMAFEALELESEKAFSVLESCLLSDENSDVRNTAIKIIAHNFPKKSQKLLKWISEHKIDEK